MAMASLELSKNGKNGIQCESAYTRFFTRTKHGSCLSRDENCHPPAPHPYPLIAVSSYSAPVGSNLPALLLAAAWIETQVLFVFFTCSKIAKVNSDGALMSPCDPMGRNDPYGSKGSERPSNLIAENFAQGT
jgi:hypothetical protein